MTGEATPRRLRSDAQRNAEAVLKAASEVFATAGVDAPVRDIANKAGVGIATIYRNFPHRSDLVAALFRSEMDSCAIAGAELASRHRPGAALELWVSRYVEFIAAKRGLAAALIAGDPAFTAQPDYFLQRLRPVVQTLLNDAAAAGEIRSGVDADDVLYAIAGLCTPPICTTSPDALRLVSLFMDGLRFGITERGNGDEAGSA